MCGSSRMGRNENMDIWYIMFWVQLGCWGIIFFVTYKAYIRMEQDIEEIKSYLNARDGLPFFEVFDNEKKDDAGSLSDTIDRLRDAFPGKRPGGREQ